MDSLDILEVVGKFPPPFNGTGTVAYRNGLELARRGHHVRVASVAHDRAGDETVDGLTVRRYPARPCIGGAARLAGFRDVGEADAVHLHAPFILGGDQAARHAARAGVPLVATYHQDLIHTGWRGAAFTAYTHLRLRRILRQADTVIVPTLDYVRSSRLARTLEAGRLVEIPNGVDVDRFRPGPARPPPGLPWPDHEPDRTFLFVGGLDRAHYFKGVEVLLHALARCPAPDARLIIVGQGELRPRYEAQARRLGLAHRVHFAGAVPDAQLPDYYRGTLATVLPSTTRGEIFGIVLAEAMACGRPVIGTALPGVRTVVDDGETGHLVPPGDVDALAHALHRLLEAPGDAQGMGKRGREKAVRAYGWEAIGERLDAVLRDAATRAT